ncbi:MAG: flagellar assembly protein FliW [Phycisphaerales bacterium]|nr:flagellar assembly protein FliW [Phycisphaerales bacterium]
MQVRTTRFGTVEITDDRVITFPKGLLGFSEYKKYCLLEPADEACFYWLQSLDDASLAFVVTDPGIFVPEYNVPIRDEQMGDLGLSTLEDAQVFVIVNKVEQTLTANLQGPLVVNVASKQAEQLVLTEKRWTTRHAIVNLAQSGSLPAAMSA